MSNEDHSMNCLAFRRRCLAEPSYGGEEFLLHERECQDCASFAKKTRAMEICLTDAIRINVPVNLAERVKMRRRVQASSWKRGRVIALAASILITLAFVGGVFFMPHFSTPLHAAVKGHIENEWESLVQKEDMGREAVKSVLLTIGGIVKDDLGTIKFASLCDFLEYGSAHLVARGAKGPILALLLKEKHISQARFMTMSKPEGTKIEGILTPTSSGSMAIVGVAGEDLYAVDRTVRDNVFWLL